MLFDKCRCLERTFVIFKLRQIYLLKLHNGAHPIFWSYVNMLFFLGNITAGSMTVILLSSNCRKSAKIVYGTHQIFLSWNMNIGSIKVLLLPSNWSKSTYSSWITVLTHFSEAEVLFVKICPQVWWMYFCYLQI